MGRRRHTPEQIITALREAEVGLARGKTAAADLRSLNRQHLWHHPTVSPIRKPNP